MIKKIIDIVSGSYSHWNKTNNEAVSIIYKDIDKVDNERQQLYKKLLICSNIISEKLLSPDRIQPDKISRSEIKKLTLEDFLKLHKNLIRLFCTLHVHIKPDQLIDIQIGYELLFEEPIIFPPKPILGGIEGVKEIIFKCIEDIYLHTNTLNIRNTTRDYTLYVTISTTYTAVNP